MIFSVVHYVSLNPAVLHAELLNILVEFYLKKQNKRTLTKPPGVGSHPSRAPARMSFLHASSTARGTSGSSPEESRHEQTSALKSSAKYPRYKCEQASCVSTHSGEQ